ncbi:synaptotagmin-10-like [Tropilaelaps mercedesae]|uniref:Synaptotagmin-10-like n=1 Tax=Tropilaelaps mercedesae TaxID=418985 RepID=A0A1V9X588_9ACAR|nr:synaptotagmin-10-like [Tropilaelaps mercedesae]
MVPDKSDRAKVSRFFIIGQAFAGEAQPFSTKMAQPWNVHLNDDQKLILVASGFSFVAFVLAATVCLVQPTCFLYKKLWGKRDKERATRIAAAKEMGLPIQLAILGQPGLSKSQRSLVSLETSSAKAETPPATSPNLVTTVTSFHRGGVRDSAYSSISSSRRGDMAKRISDPVTERSSTTMTSEDVQNQGHATITVRFLPQLNDPKKERIIGQLGVNIKDVQDLPMRPYGGLCDPYVVVQVMRDVKRMRKRKKGFSKTCEFTTQVRRPNATLSSRDAVEDCFDGVN